MLRVEADQQHAEALPLGRRELAVDVQHGVDDRRADELARGVEHDHQLSGASF
jgi:hypothetical protein